MSQTHDAIDSVPSEVDDLDVEGHGMKEVALGLGAATLLASGSAAVLTAADGPLPGTTKGAGAAVSGAASDVRGAAFKAETRADQTRQTGINAVAPVGSHGQKLAEWGGTTAADAADDVTVTVGDAVNDPFGTTDKAAYDALEQGIEARNTATGATEATAKWGGERVADATDRTGMTTARAGSKAQALSDRSTSTAARVSTGVQQDAELAKAAAEAVAKDATKDTRASTSRSDDSTTVQAQAAGTSTTVEVEHR